jgi:hypothetical protein
MAPLRGGAINMVTQRCLTGDDTSASSHAAQSAESDATAAGFGVARTPEVFLTDRVFEFRATPFRRFGGNSSKAKSAHASLHP